MYRASNEDERLQNKNKHGKSQQSLDIANPNMLKGSREGNQYEMMAEILSMDLLCSDQLSPAQLWYSNTVKEMIQSMKVKLYKLPRKLVLNTNYPNNAKELS